MKPERKQLLDGLAAQMYTPYRSDEPLVKPDRILPWMVVIVVANLAILYAVITFIKWALV